MFEKMTGNVFQNDGQYFGKQWAMFFLPLAPTIQRVNDTFASKGKKNDKSGNRNDE